MQNTGSGGLGAISIGISEPLLLLILLVVLFVVWKLTKLLWAAFSN